MMMIEEANGFLNGKRWDFLSHFDLSLFFWGRGMRRGFLQRGGFVIVK